ncbi:MAG: bifunctional phosphoribosylaminoimidazolecarboxamide formyltransferase/IMP cyclohydrolase [Planctomycetes bacterium]|nr:bifunctional phosphoribosylaminoimidazolecarboxamide formyltransferase/IMP cyclohydrolase [Planctomycetota bacterium]
MARIKTALISVEDKTGVAEFAARLTRLGVEILATGGTAHLLRESGVQAADISDYTGFPEILGGGLRALHPKVLGGLLAHRDQKEQLEELEELGIRPIDMVVVNLYPFVDIISQPAVEWMRAIENIDINGPTLVRSAAKNYTQVAVVTNPARYEGIAAELEARGGVLSEDTHFQLGLEAFRHTAHYDTTIARYLASLRGEEATGLERLSLDFVKKQDLCHGENPHQRAALYVEDPFGESPVGRAHQLAGEPLSFNSVLDLNAGLELIKEFDEPAAAIIKHRNPCAAATGSSARQAYEKAVAGASAAGARLSVALNRALDVPAAQAIVRGPSRSESGGPAYSVKAIAAPNYEDDALQELRRADWGAQLRVLRVTLKGRREGDLRGVTGGLLAQNRDVVGFIPQTNRITTEAQPSEEQTADLRFAWLCVKHATSAAVVAAKDGAMLGAGTGQVVRRDAFELALRKAGDNIRGAVLASDGPLYCTEVVEMAARHGASAIIQPGGVDEDESVVRAADRLGIIMVLTGTRHLRH